MAYARGLDFGIGVNGSRYNAEGRLNHRDLEGISFQYGIGNFSASNSISFSNWPPIFNEVTGYGVGIGYSPTFPIRTSFSVGVGLSVNLSQIFR